MEQQQRLFPVYVCEVCGKAMEKDVSCCSTECAEKGLPF